jgi:hypothetical protein
MRQNLEKMAARPEGLDSIVAERLLRPARGCRACETTMALTLVSNVDLLRKYISSPYKYCVYSYYFCNI